MMRGQHLRDEVEDLTHLRYDDMKTCCGLYTTMYPRGTHLFTATTRVVTCIPCLAFTPKPYDLPLWWVR
jgi:hypothetical protein